MPQDSRPRTSAREAPCDDCRSPEPDSLRCACGSLLARYVAGAIELKCRRCKRTVLVPIDPPSGPPSSVCADPDSELGDGDDHAPR